MRRIKVILMVAAVALASEARPDEGVTTLYVQLIRGTETDQAPAAGAKSVGPKLAGTFRGVFKCKGFWEINRQQGAVSRGKAKRIPLGNGREAEIELSSAKERKVAAFLNGKLVDRTVVPRGEAMTIIGGSREDKGVWFIVVRRDKPPD
jgi:hypothetical protein